MNISIKKQNTPRTNPSTLFFSPEKGTGLATHLHKEPHTQSNNEESVLDHQTYSFFLIDKSV